MENNFEEKALSNDEIKNISKEILENEISFANTQIVNSNIYEDLEIFN